MTLTRLALATSAAGALLCGSALADSEKDKAAIQKMFDESAASMIACDTASFGKYDAEGRTAYYPDSMEPVVEDAASKQEDIDFCKNGGKHELAYKINGVSVIGDVAIAHGSGHYKRTEPGGAVSIDSDYSFTDVLVKKAGGWKFQHSHIGAYMPMEETTAATTPADQQ